MVARAAPPPATFPGLDALARDGPRADRFRVARRGLDLAGAAVALLCLAPIGLCAAAAVFLEDGAPVLYRATRVGRHGRPFTMYKLRTMRRAAANGPAVTTAADARITRVGRVLRNARLDELPQLWNVLRGEMSLVGPRPEDPAFVSLYTDAQRVVLSVRPGMTGPAQLAFRDEARLLRPDHAHEDYVRHVLPSKLAVDLDYVARLSPWRDLGIMARTLAALFGRAPRGLAVPIPVAGHNSAPPIGEQDGAT